MTNSSTMNTTPLRTVAKCETRWIQRYPMIASTVEKTAKMAAPTFGSTFRSDPSACPPSTRPVA